MQTRTLIVSLHDVSPLTSTPCRQIVSDLDQLGLGAISYLVIPRHHRRSALREDPGLVHWLRGRVERGDEAVLHGYYHLGDPAGGVGGSVGARLIKNHYTAGEGEFFDLAYEEARERLRRGREEMAEVGLHPAGFIAPAWLLGPEAGRAVFQSGFRYTTRLGSVDPAGLGRGVRSQSLVWSVRAPWRRVVSRVWNRLLFQRLGRAELMRIGIHPPDWRFPAIRRQILELVGRALAGRRAMTYEGWVNATFHE